MPVVVKRTLFSTHVASLLLGAPLNTIFAMRATPLLLGTLAAQSCSYKTLYLSTIANTQDCTSQMPKTCYCGLNQAEEFAYM